MSVGIIVKCHHGGHLIFIFCELQQELPLHTFSLMFKLLSSTAKPPGFGAEGKQMRFFVAPFQDRSFRIFRTIFFY